MFDIYSYHCTVAIAECNIKPEYNKPKRAMPAITSVLLLANDHLTPQISSHDDSGIRLANAARVLWVWRCARSLVGKSARLPHSRRQIPVGETEKDEVLLVVEAPLPLTRAFLTRSFVVALPQPQHYLYF